MREFLQGRINLAKALIDSSLSVHYADLVLIICTVLSACASRRWPDKGKKRIDKQRFVELLIKHSPDDFHTSWVSIPSLLNDGLIGETQTPYGKPGNATRVYCDDEIDLSLEKAMEKYPKVLPHELQKHCRASLIYEQLRCGYSHEYCHGKDITEYPPSDKEVSYIGRVTNGKIKRMIGFPRDYLIRLAEYHVSILPSTYSEYPSCWWIDTYKKKKRGTF